MMPFLTKARFSRRVLRIFRVHSLWIAAVLLSGCPRDDDEPDSAITLLNNSSEQIVFYDEYRLPTDTSIATIAYPQTQENTADVVLGPNTAYEIPGPFRSLFRQLPEKVLMVYLFSRDSIEQLSWQEIVDRDIVLRRFDLTEQKLDSLNWQIEYP
jgi:hypothetical protein